MTQQKTSRDYVYERLQGLEGTQRGFHFDGRGVLTLGSGFTPIVRVGDSWQQRDELKTQLTAAGIELSKPQKDAIEALKNQMQKPGGLTAGEQREAAVNVKSQLMASPKNTTPNLNKVRIGKEFGEW